MKSTIYSFLALATVVGISQNCFAEDAFEYQHVKISSVDCSMPGLQTVVFTDQTHKLHSVLIRQQIPAGVPAALTPAKFCADLKHITKQHAAISLHTAFKVGQTDELDEEIVAFYSNGQIELLMGTEGDPSYIEPQFCGNPTRSGSLCLMQGSASKQYYLVFSSDISGGTVFYRTLIQSQSETPELKNVSFKSQANDNRVYELQLTIRKAKPSEAQANLLQNGIANVPPFVMAEPPKQSISASGKID